VGTAVFHKGFEAVFQGNDPGLCAVGLGVPRQEAAEEGCLFFYVCVSLLFTLSGASKKSEQFSAERFIFNLIIQ
jgi:hypothetical protein